MLPVLPKVTRLQQKKIASFGGVDRREGAKENCFSLLYGVDNKNGTTVETGNRFMCANVGFNVESDDILFVDNDSNGKDVYTLGKGGFYKNGTLLPFFIGNNSKKLTWVSEFKTVEINADGSYAWNGDYEHTKLFKYGEYIFAVPQMLVTDGNKTYFWDRFGAMYIKGNCFGGLGSRIRITTTTIAEERKVLRIYPAGTKLELFLNGNKQSGYFVVEETEDDDDFYIRAYTDGGVERTNTRLTDLDGAQYYTVGFKIRNIVDFVDAEVVYNRIFAVAGNRVWASVLSNPFSFDEAEGTESDAWWADTEDSESFTAVASLNGRVVAFKRNATYEVYGTVNPYTIKDVSRSIGCVCRESVHEVNGVLFLLTGEGVSVYGGSKYVNINEAFCNRDTYLQGVGKGTKYYALTSEGVFKYDYYTGLWTNVTDMQFRGIVDIDFDVFGVVGDGTLVQLTGEKKDFLEYEEDISRPWVIESISLGSGDFYAEGINKLEIRFETEGESEFSVEVARDNGEFEPCGKIKTGVGWQICSVPIGFVPCSTFKYRIKGVGKVRLRLISYCFRKGGRGDRYE